ncbi:hypothetical protein Tco_1075993 [Tanacetum coccineum]
MEGTNVLTKESVEMDPGNTTKPVSCAEGADLTIPRSSVAEVNERLANSLYGCSTCKIFGHTIDSCPKHVGIEPCALATDPDEGFQQVGKKHGKRKLGGSRIESSKNVGGVVLNKPKPRFFYRPKSNKPDPNGASTSKNLSSENEVLTSNSANKTNVLKTLNSFATLPSTDFMDDDESDDEVENVYDETGTFMKPNTVKESEGASTPVQKGLNG